MIQVLTKQRELEPLRNLKTYSKAEITPIEREGCDAIVYTFSETRGETTKYFAVGFERKARKHSFYYYFKTPEKRTDYIKTFFDTVEKMKKHKEERNRNKRLAKEAMAQKIQVGTILTGSWGYEQTNPEFYQVVKKPSKYKVVIRSIAHQHVQGTECFDSCKVKPVKDHFNGAAVTKMITPWGIGFELFCLTVCDPNKTYYKSWGY